MLSDQITSDFMIDAALYNRFLLRLRVKSFLQTSVCISFWYYILVQFGAVNDEIIARGAYLKISSWQGGA